MGANSDEYYTLLIEKIKKGFIFMMKDGHAHSLCLSIYRSISNYIKFVEKNSQCVMIDWEKEWNDFKVNDFKVNNFSIFGTFKALLKAVFRVRFISGNNALFKQEMDSILNLHAVSGTVENGVMKKRKVALGFLAVFYDLLCWCKTKDLSGKHQRGDAIVGWLSGGISVGFQQIIPAQILRALVTPVDEIMADMRVRIANRDAGISYQSVYESLSDYDDGF